MHSSELRLESNTDQARYYIAVSSRWTAFGIWPIFTIDNIGSRVKTGKSGHTFRLMRFFVYYYTFTVGRDFGGGGGWWARHVWSLGKKCNRNRRCRWDTKIRAAETHDNNIMAAFFFSFPSNIKRNSAAEYIIILYWWRFRGLSTGLHGNAFRGVFGPIATVVGIAHECFLCKTRSKRI